MEQQAKVKIKQLTEAAEIDDARELIAEAATIDGQKAVSDQALIAAAQGKRTFLGVTDYAKNLLAVGIIGEGEIDLVVRPQKRMQGYGALAFEQLLAHAVAGQWRVWVHGHQASADAMLTHHGFAVARTLLRLELDPQKLALTAQPQAPAGFYFSDFDASDRAHLDELLAVNRVAFASHPEQGNLDLADLREIMRETWFDTDDLVLLRAHADNRLAGFGWIKTTQPTSEVGDKTALDTELYVLAVHPDFASQGLGSALLEAVFAKMLAHNPRLITLYVEGDNAPALKIYNRAGFCVAATSHQWVGETP